MVSEVKGNAVKEFHIHVCIFYLLQNLVASKLLIIQDNVPVYIQHLQTDLEIVKTIVLIDLY